MAVASRGRNETYHGDSRDVLWQGPNDNQRAVPAGLAAAAAGRRLNANPEPNTEHDDGGAIHVSNGEDDTVSPKGSVDAEIWADLQNYFDQGENLDQKFDGIEEEYPFVIDPRSTLSTITEEEDDERLAREADDKRQEEERIRLERERLEAAKHLAEPKAQKERELEESGRLAEQEPKADNEKRKGEGAEQLVDVEQESTSDEGPEEGSEEFQKEHPDSQAIGPVEKLTNISYQPVDIGPYDSLGLFDPDLPEAAPAALNIPPIGQYQQPPGTIHGTAHGEPANSIPLPTLLSQPNASPDTSNWPFVENSSPEPQGSTTNGNASDQTTDSQIGIAIASPEHWYYRFQRNQCVPTGTTSQGTIISQPPQSTGPSGHSSTIGNTNGYTTGSSQSSSSQSGASAFSSFCQAPATIMNLTDTFFILALIFQSTSTTLYFVYSPTGHSGHYTDPDFQSLCSTFCKECFTLVVLLFGISRLKEPFLKPWIMVVGGLSFVLSVASLGTYFVYTTLGGSLMCLAGLLQVVIWRLVVLRWRDEDGRATGVSTPTRN